MHGYRGKKYAGGIKRKDQVEKHIVKNQNTET
jgi:hypothetical protein